MWYRIAILIIFITTININFKKKTDSNQQDFKIVDLIFFQIWIISTHLNLWIFKCENSK